MYSIFTAWVRIYTWFAEMRGWPTLVAHLIFGIATAMLYLMERPLNGAQQERNKGDHRVARTLPDQWLRFAQEQLVGQD